MNMWLLWLLIGISIGCCVGFPVGGFVANSGRQRDELDEVSESSRISRSSDSSSSRSVSRFTSS
jgi:hypothetical protein